MEIFSLTLPLYGHIVSADQRIRADRVHLPVTGVRSWSAFIMSGKPKSHQGHQYGRLDPKDSPNKSNLSNLHFTGDRCSDQRAS